MKDSFSILDVKTHYTSRPRPFNMFNIHTIPLATHQVLRGALLKEKQSDFLEQTPRKKNFQEAICNFKTRLEARGYPKGLIERTLSEVSFAVRQSALKKQTKQTKGKIMPFVTTYHQILMQKWSLIQNQPLLKTIYRTAPILSYK